MPGDTLTVKLKFASKLRRIRVGQPVDKLKIYDVLRGSNYPEYNGRLSVVDMDLFELSYCDDEGDTVALSDPADFIEALAFFKQAKKIPSFAVSFRSPQPAPGINYAVAAAATEPMPGDVPMRAPTPPFADGGGHAFAPGPALVDGPGGASDDGRAAGAFADGPTLGAGVGFAADVGGDVGVGGFGGGIGGGGGGGGVGPFGGFPGGSAFGSPAVPVPSLGGLLGAPGPDLGLGRELGRDIAGGGGAGGGGGGGGGGAGAPPGLSRPAAQFDVNDAQLPAFATAYPSARLYHHASGGGGDGSGGGANDVSDMPPGFDAAGGDPPGFGDQGGGGGGGAMYSDYGGDFPDADPTQAQQEQQWDRDAFDDGGYSDYPAVAAPPPVAADSTRGGQELRAPVHQQPRQPLHERGSKPQPHKPQQQPRRAASTASFPPEKPRAMPSAVTPAVSWTSIAASGNNGRTSGGGKKIAVATKAPAAGQTLSRKTPSHLGDAQLSNFLAPVYPDSLFSEQDNLKAIAAHAKQGLNPAIVKHLFKGAATDDRRQERQNGVQAALGSGKNAKLILLGRDGDSTTGKFWMLKSDGNDIFLVDPKENYHVLVKSPRGGYVRVRHEEFEYRYAFDFVPHPKIKAKTKCGRYFVKYRRNDNIRQYYCEIRKNHDDDDAALVFRVKRIHHTAFSS